MSGTSQPLHTTADNGRAYPANRWVRQAGQMVPVGYRAVENARISHLRSALSATGSLMLLRQGTDYSFYYPCGNGRYARHMLPLVTGNGSDGPYGAGGVHMLRFVDEVVPTGATQLYSAAANSGAGWVTSTSGSFTWLRTSTVGDTVTFTVPAGVEVMSLDLVTHTSGGGVASITVDGDNAGQVYLPKASELVSANRLSSTQLVSNGGTVPDNQRVYSSYMSAVGATQVSYPLVFSGSGSHTVQITHVGYRAGAGTAATQRTSVMSLRSWKTADAAVFDPLNALVAANVASTASAWEYATSFTPTGQTGSFMGTYHGNEAESSLSFIVDGVPVTPTDGVAITVGSSMIATRSSYLSHPVVGRVAAAQTTYTLDAQGLRFSPQITWETTGTTMAAYGMLPLNGPLVRDGFNKAMTSAYTGNAQTLPTTVPLDADFAASRSQSAWLWNGNTIAQMTILNPGRWFEDWIYSDRMTAVECRALVGSSSTTSLAKVYFTRTKKTNGTGEPIVNGTVHTYEALVRIRWFADTSSVISPTTGLAL